MAADDLALSARAEATRERLLKAALEMFAASGYSARLSDIVDHAGLTTGALYRYFDGKAGLYAALFERYDQALRSDLQSSADLEEAFERWLTLAREHDGVITAGAELVRQDELVRASKHELRERCSELLIGVGAPSVLLDRAASLLLVDVLDQYALTDTREWIPRRAPALVAAQLARLTTHGLYA
jgi:AcrR family transcriptional regulator